ncbi:MAG: hypothetical protein HOP02_14345, partial [Methylococcaceae bacterium]|nr:hypothetical protein [Methylococcaceae bacterium]
LLAVCLFCSWVPVIALSFVSAVFLKVYPVLLFPILIAKYGWRFLLYFVVFSALLCFLFWNQLLQYVPNLIGRVGFAGLEENIAPHALFFVAFSFLNEVLPEWSWGWVKNGFYVFAIIYLLINLYFDFKMYKKNMLTNNFHLASAAYLPAMLFFPNQVFTYSGIILFLVFVILETYAVQVKELKAENILPLAQVGTMFGASAYKSVTDNLNFHAIAPFCLVVISVYILLIKRKVFLKAY